jgi:nucleotide-binding universal stress UspA family protein
MAAEDDDGPILFAYDGSERAKAAIEAAGRQLSPGREAIVLTVWQPFASIPFAGGAVLPEDLETGLEHEAETVAEEGAQLARSAGFRATARAESGDTVWRSIVDTASGLGASIVVLGSHGRTGINLVLLGSVAATVSRHTDRPVMIVHAPS